jgi:hypothetical protein
MKSCSRLQRSARGVAGSGFRTKRTFKTRRTCANPEQVNPLASNRDAAAQALPTLTCAPTVPHCPQLPGDGASQPAPQHLPVVDSAVLMPTASKWHWSKSMQGILLGVGLLLGGCQLAKRVEVWESWAEAAEGIVLEMEDHADPRTFWGRLNPHHDLKVCCTHMCSMAYAGRAVTGDYWYCRELLHNPSKSMGRRRIQAGSLHCTHHCWWSRVIAGFGSGGSA